jgi:hypothetical protein
MSSSTAKSVDGDDDYMAMTFEEPAASKAETSLQRRVRQKREVGISYVFPLATGTLADW